MLIVVLNLYGFLYLLFSFNFEQNNKRLHIFRILKQLFHKLSL